MTQMMPNMWTMMMMMNMMLMKLSITENHTQKFKKINMKLIMNKNKW